MEKQCYAHCGALLGANEHNYIDDLDGTICDSCATSDGETRLGDDRIAQHYDIAKA